jgi:molybdate transport system substrate-binding protein
MFKKNLILLVVVLLTVLVGCGNTANKAEPSAKKSVELTVSAAASMKDALDAIKTVYEKKSHNKVLINFGSSGALQHQIEQGAPVDLFFSASTKQLDALEKEGLIDKTHNKNLLKNDLVLIVPKSSSLEIKSLTDLTKSQVSKLSIGTPETVPAGNYAKEALVTKKLWNAVQSKLVYANDVRQVLDYVETGNVEAGLVYRTDALTSSKVKIVSVIPESTHSPIIYPVGVLKASKHQAEIDDFYQFLQGNDAQKIFKKYGFKPVGQE